MGATTRNGRTRNRRIIPLAQPPDGWPLLMVITNPVRVSATRFEFDTYSVSGGGFPYEFIAGTGEVSLLNVNDLEPMTGTISFNSSNGKIRLDLDSAPPDDIDAMLLPWQEQARGLNGEWLPPYMWNVLTFP